MMRHQYYHLLEFGYASYGKPEFTKTSVKIPIKDFRIYEGFPGYDKGALFKDAYIVFENVLSSTRTIFEYSILEQGKFKEAYKVIDGPFTKPKGDVYLWEFGGTSFDRAGWIEWDIYATVITYGKITHHNIKLVTQ